MSVLKIIEAGNPILKETCEPVGKITKPLRRLLDDMAETMYKADGVGLAAPQVGTKLRMVVIDVGDGLVEMINPSIESKEGEASDTEGCLSVPGIYGEVKRATRVKAVYTNRWGKIKHVTAEGLFARCIQHELDHLDGQLFIDIATSLEKKEAQK